MVFIERNNHDCGVRIKVFSIFTVYYQSDNSLFTGWAFWKKSGFNIGGKIFIRWGKYRNDMQCWTVNNGRATTETEDELLRRVFGNDYTIEL